MLMHRNVGSNSQALPTRKWRTLLGVPSFHFERKPTIGMNWSDNGGAGSVWAGVSGLRLRVSCELPPCRTRPGHDKPSQDAQLQPTAAIRPTKCSRPEKPTVSGIKSVQLGKLYSYTPNRHVSQNNYVHRQLYSRVQRFRTWSADCSFGPDSKSSRRYSISIDPSNNYAE
jgi:hypothetical protein